MLRPCFVVSFSYYTLKTSRIASVFYRTYIRKADENTLRGFPLVIATVARVSRKRGLRLAVRVNKKPAEDPAQADVLKFILHRTGVRSRSQRKPR